MSASTTTPDTLVTLKVNIEGTNRRFKLPLRDLGAATLSCKLRALLGVLPSSQTIFERYSDSAAAFITLDPENASVYKQLYRAAKAKLKLRLRVTVIDREAMPAQSEPASVEDDLPSQAAQLESLKYLSPPASPPHMEEATLADVSLPNEHCNGKFDERPRRVEAIFHDNLLHQLPIRPFMAEEPQISHEQTAVSALNIEARPSCCEIPVTRGAAARNRWFAELSASAHSVHKPAEAPISTSSTYSVYCNNCNFTIPDSHFHCSTCDDGDFDLCQKCIDEGVLCGGNGHWMIKRVLENGKVITSTTETIAPRSTYNDSKSTLVPAEVEECYKHVTPETPAPFVEVHEEEDYDATRTCNCCVQEFPENNFVTCTTCDDFDLCIACHKLVKHGHHPNHAFVAAIEGTILDPLASQLCAPGRNAFHQAICDGCDQYIYGVRHKCLDCPDWDYCSGCILSSADIHPTHRFFPIYEPMTETYGARSNYINRSRHAGIYCDGPLCNNSHGPVATYIQGERYKCAVCDDTDFCAACEASPSNTHNKTHPLIKFKTPVRNVSVTTMGNHGVGAMPLMGDRRGRPVSKATETAPQSINEIATDLKNSCQRAIKAGLLVRNSATKVQTVADLKPKEEMDPSELQALWSQVKFVTPTNSPVPPEEILVAHFVRDTVEDGTVMETNTIFEQTWTLRNGGSSAWPAGCSVKFVGGDNMCATDPEHPASVHELATAAESSTCDSQVAPGEMHNFTVKMRTSTRPGKSISYWRLTGPTGMKFGHRLWCDVSVIEPLVIKKETTSEVEPLIHETPAEEAKWSEETVAEASKVEESRLSFPKLEKESPEASVHQEAPSSESTPSEISAEFGDDDLVGNGEFDDETEDGFMTDEEWDVLDASDEEFQASSSNGRKSSK